jgi:hypothetical protein
MMVRSRDAPFMPGPYHAGGSTNAGLKDSGKVSVTGNADTGSPSENPAEQGQTGNTRQNTTNQGLQQDH